MSRARIVAARHAWTGWRPMPQRCLAKNRGSSLGFSAPYALRDRFFDAAPRFQAFRLFEVPVSRGVLTAKGRPEPKLSGRPPLALRI